MLPINLLHESLRLDADTGRLFWRERPRAHFSADASFRYFHRLFVGKPADEGVYPLNGYRRVRITVQGKRYDICAHRVVYAMANGRWPEFEIDHIDRCRVNNRPSNLRDVPHKVNAQNRRSRFGEAPYQRVA